MDFPNVEAFVAVVDCAGFTRAASALHLSQPALSRRIGLLEHELRHALFDRGRRGIRLTDVGQTFLPHARAALACLRDGAAAVKEVERGDAGTLTLAIVGTLASTGVAAQLGRFRDAHPGLRVQLRTGSSAEVSSLVRRGDATLGLRYFADPAADLVSRDVYGEPLLVVARARHPLAAARRLAPARLRRESWVAFPARRGAAVDPFGQIVTRTLGAVGLDAAEIVAIDSLTAQKRLVEAGFGVALVPASSVREELSRGSLRALDVPAMRASIDVALIHRAGAFLSRAARWLMEALSERPDDVALQDATGRRGRSRGPKRSRPS